MALSFKKVIEKATTINAKHVKAVKLIVRPKVFRTIFLDDRTRGFDNVKSFAMDDQSYYVCCPCCMQIEQIKVADFKGGSTLDVKCTSKKNSEIFKLDQTGSSTFGYKMAGYTVNLKGWEPEDKIMKGGRKNGTKL
ncbi:hypothetical protein F8154_08910 [Alkaliphilus pronyensis]|uniref:Uncharacterized protein n=1 Tax=Alkaliphilus pronyensis TaxID=1482732 RepID=A0A6I0F0W7_9FIRM|nr:hypothetical protein [Alkaliphilus pronyensis]KAB3534414.1 hypothetical protein F8154_08910 [Alkaliphilus pronyensis]